MRAPGLSGGIAVAAVLLGLGALCPGRAAAFPTTGVQKLLVVPVEYDHSGCPADNLGKPTCPRNTAAQLQTLLQNGLTAYYGNAATGSKTTWQVKVLANPNSSNGWWPSERSVADLEALVKKAGTNWSNFASPGSPGRDAAEIIVSRALQKGVISTFELGSYTRFMTIHNWHTFGGQSYGRNPLSYTAVYTSGNSVLFKTYLVTNAFVNEGRSDGEMVRVAEHELGHELGPRDLYGQPCPLWPPGEPAPLPYSTDGEREARTECMSTWDLMGLTGTRNPALTYYTRVLLGWAPSFPPNIRYEPAEFSGSIDLSSLEYPNGDPLALHIPDDPERLILARAFGNMGYYQGFNVECRRTAWNDPIAPPGQGLLITYVDSTRAEDDKQIVVARRFDDPSARQDILSARITPGNSFTSLGRNFNVSFTGYNGKGGCTIFLNRPSLIAETVSFIPAVNPFEGASAPYLGQGVNKSIYTNPGVILNGPRPPIPKPRAVTARDAANSRTLAKRALAKSIHVKAPAKGTPSTIRFVYGNAGGKAGKGIAIVRVQQPWQAQARCGALSKPQGKVIKQLTLPSLAPGAAGVGKVTWRPRSSRPAAITVTLRGKGAPVSQGESATTVVGFASAHTSKKHRATMKIPLTLTAGPKCAGKVPYAVTPSIVPKGWKVTAQGTAKALRKGHPVHVTVLLRPPKGAKRAAVDVPITVSFGGSPAEPAESDQLFGPTIPAYELAQTVGIDLLGRVAPPGASLPQFFLPASAQVGPEQDKPYPPHGTIPGPTLQQTIGITGCSAAAGQIVTVDGTVDPPRGGLTVHLTYTPVNGPPPMPAAVSHDVMTNAAGTFSDLFDRQSWSWSVVAAVDADELYSDAVSLPCSIPIP
jgi:hypothetical protein